MLAGRDLAEAPHEPLERLAERRPVLEVQAAAQLLADCLAAEAPHAPAHTASFHASRKCMPWPSSTGSVVADDEVVVAADEALADPVPLVVVDHRAPAVARGRARRASR